MSTLRVAPLGVVLAAALAGTTGFCTFNMPPEPSPKPPITILPPVRVLPEAIIPYPLPDPT